MSSINIGLININGLRDTNKQSVVLSYIKRHHFDIILLQDSHVSCTNESNHVFKEWPF